MEHNKVCTTMLLGLNFNNTYIHNKIFWFKLIWAVKFIKTTNEIRVKYSLADNMRQGKKILPLPSQSDTIYQPFRSSRIWHKVNF